MGVEYLEGCFLVQLVLNKSVTNFLFLKCIILDESISDDFNGPSRYFKRVKLEC